MSVHTTPSTHSDPTDAIADRLVREFLASGVDAAVSALLTTASGGDPALLRGIVLIALGLGELVGRDGRWRWCPQDSRSRRLAEVIEARASGLSHAQLVALRALTDAWVRPNQMVTADSPERSRSQAPGRIGLTARQQQVLALLSDGLTVEAIARRLSLSPRTVGKHLERMYRRLGTSDRLSAVLRAKRIGLLSPTGVVE
jgi:DNA-binding CsgD family transcriptional regulator